MFKFCYIKKGYIITLTTNTKNCITSLSTFITVLFSFAGMSPIVFPVQKSHFTLVSKKQQLCNIQLFTCIITNVSDGSSLLTIFMFCVFTSINLLFMHALIGSQQLLPPMPVERQFFQDFINLVRETPSIEHIGAIFTCIAYLPHWFHYHFLYFSLTHQQSFFGLRNIPFYLSTFSFKQHFTNIIVCLTPLCN